MREESHLDEMRSAIRGDFERLAERRGDQELMRVVETESEVEAAVEDPVEPPPDQEPEAEREPDVAEGAEAGAPRRSWFSRFLSP